MPLNTLPDMILGFIVILGILLVYSLSLIVRTNTAKTRSQQTRKE